MVTSPVLVDGNVVCEKLEKMGVLWQGSEFAVWSSEFCTR